MPEPGTHRGSIGAFEAQARRSRSTGSISASIRSRMTAEPRRYMVHRTFFSRASSNVVSLAKNCSRFIRVVGTTDCGPAYCHAGRPTRARVVHILTTSTVV